MGEEDEVYRHKHWARTLQRYQGTGLSIYQSVCLSLCLSVYPSICLSVYLSIYLSICLSIYLSIYLTIQKNGFNKKIFLGMLIIFKILSEKKIFSGRGIGLSPESRFFLHPPYQIMNFY